jgi:hypothetical protein
MTVLAKPAAIYLTDRTGSKVLSFVSNRITKYGTSVIDY